MQDISIHLNNIRNFKQFILVLHRNKNNFEYKYSVFDVAQIHYLRHESGFEEKCNKNVFV